MSEKVFVYGTLKPGHSRWPILEAHCEPGAPVVGDQVAGRLWSTPWGWPALTDGDGLVPGVVVELRRGRGAAALAELDVVEGTETGLSERREVVTVGGVRCWAYLWPNPTDGFESIVVW